MSEHNAIVSMVTPIADKISHLSREGRITLLSALLAQEFLTLPVSERAKEFDALLDQMPGILRSSEEGMRIALAENARDEA